MVRVILERSFATPLPTPIPYETWDTMHQQVDACLKLRGVTWVRSYISQDGHRAICEFDAPYADLVREVCRETGIAFERIWRAEILPGNGNGKVASGQSLILAETTYNPPMTPEQWEAVQQQAIACSAELGIKRLFSLAMPDGSRVICVFHTAHAELVRSLYRKLGYPFDRIWRADILALERRTL
jgi:hypothetical protein